jgi:penicillin-binding protein-related factor A (putative recombinase)
MPQNATELLNKEIINFQINCFTNHQTKQMENCLKQRSLYFVFFLQKV